MRGNRILVLMLGSLLAAACGSGNGTYPGDEQTPIDDASLDTTTPPQDGGNPFQDSGSQDSTLPPPQLDATLEVGFGDGAIWTADSGKGGGDSGLEAGGSCAPDGILCNGNVVETCQNGQLSTSTCGVGLICANGYGCVFCSPGSGTCTGNIGTLCDSDGGAYVTNNCDPQLGLTCNGGVCLGDCADIGQSYIGCEYYAATMTNPVDQATFPFAVSIANTTSKSATVNITGPHAVGGNPFTVLPNTIQSIVLPWESSLSTTSNTVMQTGGAYHIKSTEPVTVYQFNARDYQLNVTCASDPTSPPCHSYTNDASLLIPVNALTGNYYVVTMPDWLFVPGFPYANVHYPGTIAIVGTQNGTSVQFTPNGSVTAGAGINATGMSTVTLNQGDVLEIAATQNATTSSYGTDPSGSHIVASAPVEVFGGSACAYVPYNQPACDHLEEVMFPVETLKADYLVVPPNMTGITTGKAPSHFVRIVGTVNGTSLTYAPLQAGAPATLNAGQVGIFESSTPFRVTSSSPIIVGLYMESANNYNTNPNTSQLNGDPAMSVAVATAQFRNSYAFTAPNNYQVNWATVIAKTGATVTIDSTTIAANQFTAIGSSGYGYYYYGICNGNCGSFSANHTASSASPFGIQVYGYGSYTSYWYPGGLNLNR